MRSNYTSREKVHIYRHKFSKSNNASESDLAHKRGSKFDFLHTHGRSVPIHK